MTTDHGEGWAMAIVPHPTTEMVMTTDHGQNADYRNTEFVVAKQKHFI